MKKGIVLSGVILIVVAIILGAFGAHGLKEVVSAEKIASFEVGVRYEIYIGIILLILGFNADKLQFSLKWVVNLVLLGAVMFCGSIYFLSLQELTTMKLSFLGPITPIGGSLMIAGLIVFVVKLLRN